MKKILAIYVALVSSCVRANLEPHERYWTYRNVWPNMFDWSQEFHTPYSQQLRNYIKERLYKSVLDVPCGACSEFFGYQHDNVSIEYYGMDITPKHISFARKMGIGTVQEGNIEDIPYPDDMFDVCYARDILEHLADYKKAVQELIRTACKEVIITFFISPGQEVDRIFYKDFGNYGLFENRYNKASMEQFIMNNAKVENIAWEYMDQLPDRAILHIYLKDAAH